MKAPSSTGILFVAFAVRGSRPMNINIGNDTADPEEATVLRNPHARPAAAARTSVHQS